MKTKAAVAVLGVSVLVGGILLSGPKAPRENGKCSVRLRDGGIVSTEMVDAEVWECLRFGAKVTAK